MISKIKDTVMDTLAKHEGTQTNLSSEAAREMLAEEITTDLKNAAKNDTEMYVELYV
jgi:flagellar basal body-associated protein FliL